MKHFLPFTIKTALPLALLLAAISTGCDQNSDSAKNSNLTSAIGQTFASPEEASQGLAAALRNNDSAALSKIVGPDGAELVNSGDEVLDHARREKFLAAYDTAHSLEKISDDSYTLVVGAQRWPLPIPIVQDATSKQWYFDTDAGKEELINRRIGQNELDTIQTCEAIVDAQKEYARLDPDRDGLAEYARKIISDPGKRNGLYWETAPNEPPSPLGPLVAEAVEEGYGATGARTGEPKPYHGYMYRLLLLQGSHAPRR